MIDFPPAAMKSLWATRTTLSPALEMYSTSLRLSVSSLTDFEVALMMFSKEGEVVVSSLPFMMSSDFSPSRFSFISIGYILPYL